MKKILLFIFLSTSICAQTIVNTEKLKNDFNNNLSKQNTAVFEENKGQVKDQHWQPRPDVLFYGKSEGMNYYIRNNGMSYQLSRVESWKEEADIKGLPDDKNKRKVPDQVGTYRVDADWLCFNEDFSVEKGKTVPGYNNYYNVPEGVEPALFVKQYEAVTLKNLWNGIDVHYYNTEGFLETDYLVAPGADYRQIQMEIKGADLSIDAEGYLAMKTPFGEIKEGKLKVYQENKLIAAQWKLNQKGDKIWQVSFDIPEHNPDLAMRIDPVVRVWGTYFGGSDFEQAFSCKIDLSGNIFMSGITASFSSITSNGHQNLYSDNGDAFLVKFNSNGVRQWGTYYGGNGYDEGFSCNTDRNGNVFLAGDTKSNNLIASGGHQNLYGGGIDNGDAFLVKFNSNGVRQWGTYYGGNNDEEGFSCFLDKDDNVYLAGTTNSLNSISFNGHQNSHGGGDDAFLVKFNSNGVRQWGSYYGGIGDEIGFSCSSDITGNVYLSGNTYSSNSISFNGHQNSQGFSSGGNDAFLVKFTSNGVRQWGTYYGGMDYENGNYCYSDSQNNVYLVGETFSFNNISFNGHQNNHCGILYNFDAFLVKFDSVGNRIWGTYYGSIGSDIGHSCSVNQYGDVFLSGVTTSLDSISFNGFQQLKYGYSDGYIVKFNSLGQRIWGTYYGGNDEDVIFSNSNDSFNNIIITGYTYSTTNISQNGHQNSFGGGDYDAFLVKFNDNGNPNPIQNIENSKINSFVYPNPAKEKATILLEGIIDPNDLELEVYDVVGKLIHKDSNYNDNSFEIFVLNWNAGVYIYNISQKGKVISRGKMVVE